MFGTILQRDIVNMSINIIVLFEGLFDISLFLADWFAKYC